MKTAEEIEQLAAKLYPDVSFKKDVESEDTFRTNEIRRIERLAFAEGYKQGYDYGYEIGKKAWHRDGYKK
jgi:flagellar biosynthesis/type III secretory pathway protein FliH